LVAAYWSEVKRLVHMIRRAFTARRVLSDVVAATVLTVAMVAGNSIVAWDYLRGRGRSDLASLSERRAALLVSKRQAYDWISRSTAANARIVAYQDGALYLYTGRQSMRPMVFTTAEFLDPTRLPSGVEHMADVARAIDAGYWLVSDDDFGAESSVNQNAGESRLREIERVLPLVFRSSDGRVRIYRLGCVENPAEGACAEADRVLFPGGDNGPSSAPNIGAAANKDVSPVAPASAGKCLRTVTTEAELASRSARAGSPSPIR
jgi:hypothetical protein